MNFPYPRIKRMLIGVLALQGAFKEHVDMLKTTASKLGVQIDTRLVRSVVDLGGVDGLIIPGGESTTMEIGLRNSELLELLKDWIRNDKPVFGTCAGLILLADRIEGRDDESILGGIGVTVQRNYYGHQISSFKTNKIQSNVSESVEGIFIRAPAIKSVDTIKTKVLATLDGKPVAVQCGPRIGLTFHPELTADTYWHELFIKEIIARK